MILFYSIAFLFGIFFSIVVLLLGKPIFFQLSHASLELLNEVLSSETDDDIKASAVQKKAIKTLKELVYLSILLLVLGFIFYLPIFISSWLGIDTIIKSDYAFSWQHWLIFSLGSLLPFFFYRKKNKNYSEVSKLLHRIVLNNYNVGKWLLKREFKKLTIQPKGEFIIVSGLARSGTTSLMNYLAQHHQLKSLDYSNMPFLLAPNLWKKIYKPKAQNFQNRAHNDGLKICFSSAEALEEYFFKSHLNDNFIKDEIIYKHEISNEIYQDYIKYQALVRGSDDSVYLAKNNNFLLRYKSIREYNKDFKFLVMVRDPLSHANSLLKQHQNFIKQQNEDSFVLEYMNWLGHHEFGLNQKLFQFDEPVSASENKDTLEYWLQIWINYYNYLLQLDDENIILINYDMYCQYPQQHLEYILNKLGLKLNNIKIESFTPNEIEKPSEALKNLEQANQIFEQLQSKALPIQP